MFGGGWLKKARKIQEFIWVAFISLRLSQCEGFGVCVCPCFVCVCVCDIPVKDADEGDGKETRV